LAPGTDQLPAGPLARTDLLHSKFDKAIQDGTSVKTREWSRTEIGLPQGPNKTGLVVIASVPRRISARQAVPLNQM